MVAEYGTRDIVLNINNLYKSYIKGKLVNDNISLALGMGEIFGLLGPNGAGKTTLVSQIIGLAKPDSGSITIDGLLFSSANAGADQWTDRRTGYRIGGQGTRR